MAFHANRQTGVGWYSQPVIAKWVGCSLRTAREELKALSEPDSSPVRITRRARFLKNGRGRTSDEWRLILCDQPAAPAGYSKATNRNDVPLEQPGELGLTGSSLPTNRQMAPDQPAPPAGDPCRDPRSDPRRDPASRSSAGTEPFNLTAPENARKRAPKPKKPTTTTRKQRASKTPSDPTAHKQVTAQYFESFSAKNGRDPIFGGAEGAAVTRLLAKLKGDAEEARRRIVIAYTKHWRDSVTILDIAKNPDAFAVASTRSTNGRRGPVQHHGVDVLTGARQM